MLWRPKALVTSPSISVSNSLMEQESILFTQRSRVPGNQVWKATAVQRMFRFSWKRWVHTTPLGLPVKSSCRQLSGNVSAHNSLAPALRIPSQILKCFQDSCCCFHCVEILLRSFERLTLSSKLWWTKKKTDPKVVNLAQSPGTRFRCFTKFAVIWTRCQVITISIQSARNFTWHTNTREQKKTKIDVVQLTTSPTLSDCENPLLLICQVHVSAAPSHVDIGGKSFGNVRPEHYGQQKVGVGHKASQGKLSHE